MKEVAEKFEKQYKKRTRFLNPPNFKNYTEMSIKLSKQNVKKK